MVHIGHKFDAESACVAQFSHADSPQQPNITGSSISWPHSGHLRLAGTGAFFHPSMEGTLDAFEAFDAFDMFPPPPPPWPGMGAATGRPKASTSRPVSLPKAGSVLGWCCCVCCACADILEDVSCVGFTAMPDWTSPLPKFASSALNVHDWSPVISSVFCASMLRGTPCIVRGRFCTL
jgi:hypothetical protein